MDDVNICFRNFADHLRDLRKIFAKIRDAGLKLEAKTCVIGLLELIYLGHVVSAEGLRPNPDKIQAVMQFPHPANLECVQSFIGLVNYSRRFVQGFALIAAPFYRLLKKSVTFS